MASKYEIFLQEGVKELLYTVDNVTQKHGSDFYLLGALAKDYWLTRANVNTRYTKDVDLAVLVSDLETYKNIKSELISKYGFKETSNAFALQTSYGYPIDLLPLKVYEIEYSIYLIFHLIP